MRQTRVIGLAWLCTVGLALGQDVTTRPTSQPATRVARSEQERLNDLLSLIEGQNSAEVRRTGARELLRQDWPEAGPRIAGILAGTNSAARIAVATALADLPERLVDAYLDPLVGMLRDNDASVREAGASALAAYKSARVIRRLRMFVLSSDQPRPARIAAISALGLMTEREAVETLIQAISDPDSTVSSAALTALSRATAIDFNDDPGAAWAWWEENMSLSLNEWQQRQIDRLGRDNRELRRRLDSVESRLTKLVEQNFSRSPDTERVSLLAGYLSDTTLAIRLLGLRLAQQHVADGRTLPPDLLDRVRELLASPEAREQAAAVRTVASFREPRDAERFAQMLKTAHSREVRLALLNALGHTGGAGTTTLLLDALEDADEQLVTEAVAALGKLAERNVIASGSRADVVQTLLTLFERTKSTDAALRERLLWAFGNLAEPAASKALKAGLSAKEDVAVRRAAVRGIAALKDPQMADALVATVGDADAGVRKLAVEALAALGSSEQHVDALWERMTSVQETDETIRQAALRGVIEMLVKMTTPGMEKWLARVPQTTAQERTRAVELLERLVKLSSEAEPPDQARVGAARARLAGHYAQLDRPADAVTAYCGAISELQAAGSDSCGRTALELLRVALLSGRYDMQVAAAVGGAIGKADRDAVWEVVRTSIEARLTPENLDQALAMITALETNPPGAWTPEAAEGLRQLRHRAAQIKQVAAGSPAARATNGAESRLPG